MQLRLSLSCDLSLTEVRAALEVQPRGILYMHLEQLEQLFATADGITMASRNDETGELFYAIIVEGNEIGYCRKYARTDNKRVFWQSYIKGVNLRIRTSRLPDMHKKLAKMFARIPKRKDVTEDLL